MNGFETNFRTPLEVHYLVETKDSELDLISIGRDSVGSEVEVDWIANLLANSRVAWNFSLLTTL